MTVIGEIIDLRKAFDTVNRAVNYDILIRKLQMLGLSNSVLK